MKLNDKYLGIEEKYKMWMLKWKRKAMTDPQQAGKLWDRMVKRMKARLNELRKSK